MDSDELHYIVQIGVVIAMITVACIIVISIGAYIIKDAFGENYTYNMSESVIQDEWVTQTCIKLQINSPECDMVYGGITDKVSDGRLK